MNLILRSFFRGLLFVVPVAISVYVVYAIFIALDNLIDTERWLGIPMPGLGALIALALITLIGMFASNILTRWMLQAVDRLFKRMPLVKIIYSALKDLLEAFVGEKKKFDRPVLVKLGDASGGELLGFITGEELEWLDRAERVAVYLPQSYNFAGNLVVYPRDRVTPLTAEPSAVMQFIVSGGVSKVAPPPPVA